MASIAVGASTSARRAEDGVASLKLEVARLAGMLAVRNTSALPLPPLPALPAPTRPIVPLRRPHSPTPSHLGSTSKRGRIEEVPDTRFAEVTSHIGLTIGPYPRLAGLSPSDLMTEIVSLFNKLPTAWSRARPSAALPTENNHFAHVYFDSAADRDAALSVWPPAGFDDIGAAVENNLPALPAAVPPSFNSPQLGGAHFGQGGNRGGRGGGRGGGWNQSQRGAFQFQLSWNIKGELENKLEDENLVAFLSTYELILLQETHLLPGQHESLTIPRGYAVYSCPRPFPPNLASPWGGVLALVHHTVEHSFRADLSSPDVLVLDIAGMCVINAYLPPQQSTAMTASDPNPVERFIAALVACSARASVPILVVLDGNGRTGSRQSAAWAPGRVSQDSLVETRGRELIRVFKAHELAILNGMLTRFPSTGTWTSKQHNGTSVIDYMACGRALLECIESFDVGPEDNFWSDHAPLMAVFSLVLTPPPPLGPVRGALPRRKSARTPAESVYKTRLDDLVARSLARALNPLQAAAALYGEVATHAVDEFVTVYTDGSCLKPNSALARTGAGICWGLGSQKNSCARAPGRQTSNRGELYAALLAVSASDLDRPLRLYTDSQNTIRVCCHWAPTYAMTGWACANADLVVPLVWALKRRRALTRMEWVEGHSGNALNDEADRLAKEGALLPPSFMLPSDEAGPEITTSDCTENEAPLPRVTTSLPRRPLRDALGSAYSEREEREGTAASQAPTSEHERGKRARRTRAAENLDALEHVQTERDFWVFVYHVSHPRSRMAVLAVEVLTYCFAERMNMPSTLPPEFDAEVVRQAAAVAAAMGDCTIDTTRSGHFSRRFSTSEIARLKARIRTRPPGRSVGFDMVAFALLLDIPNDVLQELYDECLTLRDVPDGWLVTILVGILKRGGSPTDAASYRTVGLESCLLKFFMMLIDARVRAWAEDEDLLPPTQNGFRSGRRTNNNAFILRCAADRARALRKTLYVASIDISNAFPSVNHDLLWTKLQRLGMGGPIFDTYRTVYRYMTYCVRVEREYSDLFTSDMGVLIGDPASPIMWLLYFADLSIPETEDDIALSGTRMSHLEQADDIVIFATSAAALQQKLDAFYAWCCRNLLRINGRKSWWMPLGARPNEIPVLRINGDPVPMEEKKMYVGMLLTSSLAHDQRAHVAEKVAKAHRISCLTFSILDRKCLELPPRPARKLYMGLVDPHMTHGCEVLPDATLGGTEDLERVQKTYLRKMLRVGPRTCVVPLYTETGISPIRYRRADLAVRFLGYTLQLHPGDLVRCAVLDSRDLALAGKRSWFGDLRRAVAHLPGGGVDLGFPLSADDVDDLRASLKADELLYLRTATDECRKLPLLTGRLHENCFAQSTPRAAPTSVFRAYLKISARDHRTALTRLLFSDHMLAVERLRYEGVPRARRLCRFCENAVEDELHALFECDGHDDLNGHRQQLVDDVARLKGPEALARLQAFDIETVFHFLLADADTVAALARCVYHIMRCFDSVPIRRG